MKEYSIHTPLVLHLDLLLPFPFIIKFLFSSEAMCFLDLE